MLMSRTPSGERRGEEDADGGVLLEAAAAREHADADGDEHGGDERAEQQVGAEQVGDGDAGQDGVRQGVAEERHGAQHDEGADHRAEHADDERGEQGALHELRA